MKNTSLHEQIQRLAASLIARNPAGEGLVLVGGFGYRLLRGGARRSHDIDYHWDGDLDAKQRALLRLLKDRLAPLLRRQFQLDVTIERAAGSDADSPFVRTIVVVGTRRDVRVNIPIDVTSIPCADPPDPRSVDGTLFLTASDADMVESKVMAVFSRPFVAHRDLLDLFFYEEHLRPDSTSRIADKMQRMKLDEEQCRRVWRYLVDARDHHVRSLDQMIGEYVDPSVAANLRTAGGGAVVYARCLALLRRLLPDLATGERA